MLIFTQTAFGSNLIYKSYIVRYDRGWDILCEPYVVKKGDYILKIFRQKGEIAHQDFRDFIGIFKRLNPHVTDVNMIRIGQSVDIPLRKLEQGELPGQSMGVVTIPFVSLSKVSDIVIKHTNTRTIQHGDTISELITKHFGGRYGSKIYLEGLKLLQAANPQIKDINQIYTGQKIYLPDPSIREKQWYDTLYDDKGNLRKNINDSGNTSSTGATGVTSGLDVASRPEKPKTPESPLAQAADMVGGQLIDKGTYFVPKEDGTDFEIDLSQHPLLDMHSKKLLFTQTDSVMGQTPEQIESIWPKAKVMEYSESSTTQDIVASIFNAMQGDVATDTDVGFEDNGVYVSIHAKWVKTDADNRQLCIIPINTEEEQTPESIRRYLEQNNIVLKEILPGGHTIEATSDNTTQRHHVGNVLTIASGDQKTFVKRLAKALHFTFAPDISIKFPYAGIQIEAFTNLLSTPVGNEILVDFGELYGDAIDSIQKSGLTIVQIKAEDTDKTIVTRLLSRLGENYAENPAFMVVQRPSGYTTTVQISGILYTDAKDSPTLMTSAALHPAVTDLLNARGIAVVTW